MQPVFNPCNILLPDDADMTRWAVIACDQHTSEPEYWQRVRELVGDAPSTLNMMIPELEYKSADISERIADVKSRMNEYHDGELFRTIPNSYMYIERTLYSGKVRRGIIGALDLEQYGGEPEARVTGTEDVVPERLPLRVQLRDNAAIDMPHVLAMMEAPFDITPEDRGELLYDFELMEHGGHIRGWRVDADCGSIPQPELVLIGDGNHSLASAKICWEKLKPTLPEDQRGSHPARFAMAELVSIHDPAIEFEPINRVIFDCVPEQLIADIHANLRGGYTVCYAHGDHVGLLNVPSLKALQSYLDERCASGTIDYIHGDDVAVRLAREPNRLAFVFAALTKDDFFDNIRNFGSLPRKAFSMGSARDKRYYLDCRSLQVRNHG